MAMIETLEPYLRPTFAVAAMLYLLLAVRVARSGARHTSNMIGFFLFLIGMLVAGAAFSHGTEDLNHYGIGRTLTMFGAGFVPVALFLIYREYIGKPPSSFFTLILSLIPVATTALAMTNHMHNAVWAAVETASGLRFTYATDHLWFNRVHAPYSYGLFAFSAIALAAHLPTIAPAHRRTVWMLLACALLPFLVSLGNTMFGIGPAEFPFTAATLVLLLPLYVYASLQMRFYEFSPLAYQTLFDHVRDPVIVLDVNQRIVCANKSAQDLLGGPENELIGRHLWEDFEAARAILTQAKELDVTQTLRLNKDYIYELSVRPLTDPKGQSTGMVVVCRDVTEKRNALSQLADKEQLIRTLIDTSSNGIMRFARDSQGYFRCIYANGSSESYINDGERSLVGKPLSDLVQLHPDRLITHFDSTESAGKTISYEAPVGHDDAERWLRIVGEPVDNDFSVTLVDITQSKREEHKMLAEVLQDPLTGLLNRRGFEQEGIACIENNSQGAVLYLDLNHFKTINDTFGHKAGDVLLKAFGHRLEYCLRPEDILGRLGGDEFAIVLPGLNLDDTKHVARRLVQTASEEYIIEGRQIRCTASVGVAMMPEHGNELWQLLSVADEAMYNAKTLSRHNTADDHADLVEVAIAS